MSHAATFPGDQPASHPGPSMLVSTLLVGWLGLVSLLGTTGAFVPADGTPPLRLLVAVLAPVVSFLILYRVSPAVRAYALTADLRLVVAAQAWRFGGFAFLALYAYGVLPGYFAWPAGLGDMAIAAAAPRMLVGLTDTPGFGTSRTFVLWNVLGILDLIVAVTAGAIVPLVFPTVVGAIPTGALTRLPLVLIPGFFVPGYIILHAIALSQARAAALAARTR